MFKNFLTKKKVAKPPPRPTFPLIRNDPSYNPNHTWKTIKELGDGAFGKVYKVQYNENSKNEDSIHHNHNNHNNNDHQSPQPPKANLKTIAQLNTNNQCAAKIIPINNKKEENPNSYFNELKEYYVEIHILSLCNNEFIIKLIEAAIYDAQLWVVIEICDGGALDDVMMTIDRPFKEIEILATFIQSLYALDYLHTKAKIIHRDVKAGNLLLTSKGYVKLADFGVSAVLKNFNEGRTTFIGSPYWMAPEVIQCETFKDEPYFEKCDIWSLGITLIELAQLEPPHNELNPVRVLIRISRAEPPGLDAPHRYSANFNKCISSMLVKSPASRRPSCRELIDTCSWLRNYSVTEALKTMKMIYAEAYEAEVIEQVIEVHLRARSAARAPSSGRGGERCAGPARAHSRGR